MNVRRPVTFPTRDVVRVLAIIFGFYIGLRLLWVAHPVVFLFFLGVLFALPIAQGADWFEARRIPRGVGVTIILTVFLGLLIGGGVGMAPILRSQSQELQQRLPEALDKIDAWLGHRANGVLGILFNESSSTDSVRRATVVDSTTIVRTSTTHADTVALGSDLRREMTRQFSGAQHSFLRVMTSTFAITGAFLLVLFIAAYIAADPPLYHGGILLLVPVLMKRGVVLPPAMTLGIRALMSVLFGFLGLLVAVPLLAAILTIVKTMSGKDLREISAEADEPLLPRHEAV